MDRYILIKRLGGHIHHAFDITTKKEVVIKRIPVKLGPDGNADYVIGEIIRFDLVRHCPHVVKLLDTIISPLNDEASLVMDLMDMNLRDFLVEKPSMTMKQRAFIIHDILKALSSLHGHGIVHGKLCPDKILIRNNKAYISGFGFDDEISCYSAPELCLKSGNSNASDASDAWSVGCIMAEMMLRNKLFHGRGPKEMLDQIACLLGKPSVDVIHRLNASEYFDGIIQFTGSLDNLFPNYKYDCLEVDIVHRLLTFDPLRRLTIEEAMQHKYFEF